MKHRQQVLRLPGEPVQTFKLPERGCKDCESMRLVLGKCDRYFQAHAMTDEALKLWNAVKAAMALHDGVKP